MQRNRNRWSRLVAPGVATAALGLACSSSLGRSVPTNQETILAQSTVDEYAPRVCVNNVRGEFLVSYVSSNGQNVGLRRVIPGSGVWHVPHPFTSRGMNQGACLAHSTQSDRYLVVSYLPDLERVIGRLLDGAGNPLGSELVLMEGALWVGSQPVGGRGDGVQPIDIAYNSIRDEFMVTAQIFQGVNITPSGVVGRRVSADGTLLDQPELLAPVINNAAAHGIAYAPVTDPGNRGGRYMVVTSGAWFYLESIPYESRLFAITDADGNEITTRHDFFPAGPGDDLRRHETLFDVEYGEYAGTPSFAVVWADYETPELGYSHTGVWAATIDAATNAIPDVSPVARAVSFVDVHYDSIWSPRLAYDPIGDGFEAVWRESPTPDPINDPQLMHIRRAQAFPGGPNEVVSSGFGSDPATDAAPVHPRLAIGDDGSRLYVWEDPRDGDRDIWYYLEPALTEQCSCDENADTIVDVGDLLSFLSAWFVGAPVADIDGSGTVDIADLLGFLDCWFAAQSEGC